MEKLKVQLEPTNIVGGARKGYELLKVTDQTVGLYRDVKWRTFEDLQTAVCLQSSSILHLKGGEKEGEAAAATAAAASTTASTAAVSDYEKDVQLEQMEAKIFKMVDESDRSLFIDYMRSETELFLLFADWTEKQRRKLIDIQLRNSDVWAEVLREKRNLIKELQSLTQIFQLMKTPPVLAEGVGEEAIANSSESVRQMTILGAVNQANELEINKETIIALKRRAVVGSELAAQLRATKKTLSQGVIEQAMFLEIIDRLTRRWNVIKVPYQQQVFQASDVNYPYRAELWVELVTLPANYWAVESLEDISLSLAPMLWEAADNAGYQPAIDFSDVDAWKEKRLARTFGHPFLLSPPVPVGSPFGQAPWVEVFAASKAEEEKLPEEAWGHDLGMMMDRDNDDHAPVNIVVRLSGDVGIAVKESKHLQVHIKLVRLAGEGGLDFTAAQEAIVSDAHDDVVNQNREQTNNCFKRVSMTSGLDAVHENLEDFLTGVQRVCIERGMFAVLQSQAMRVLREAGVNDEETVACVQERLKGSRTVKIEVLKNLILLRPVRLTPDSSLFKITSRPEMTSVPASWCVWPFSGQGKSGRERPLVYACAKARISVRSCLSDEIKFVIHDIPILAPEVKSVIASADVEVRILFKTITASSSNTSEEDPALVKALRQRIGAIEEMAVCFVRQQVLSAMDSRELFNNAFDIYPANMPGLRTKHQGALLLQRLTSWILTHLAMTNF